MRSPALADTQERHRTDFATSPTVLYSTIAQVSSFVIAMLIHKPEKPEGNLVPQHILLVGRYDEAIGNTGNLLAFLGIL